MARSTPRPALSRAVARRDFLQASTGVVAASLAAPTAIAGHARTIRIGLVGCGGRGTGAALQAACADPDARVVALGDAFADQVASAAHVLARDAGPRFDCPQARRFTGADAYRRVLDAGVDAVVIAAPPHLRPLHVEAAVAAGCHVFCETPAATHVAGAVRVAAALDQARAAGRSVASGLHARRDATLAASIDGILAGSIGIPRRVEVRWAPHAPWWLPRRPEWTAAESRLRNWITDASLSGGPFVERHVHGLDRALWVLGDRVPVSAEPLGGAGAARCAVRYRFADGAEILAVQATGGDHAGRETVTGSRGACEVRLAGDGRRFQATMDDWLAGIRSGRAMDDSGILVRGTLVAIMGRLVSSSRRSLGWRELLATDAPAFPGFQIDEAMNLGGV